MPGHIDLLKILLILSQNWHVRIFKTPPFSMYPDKISYGTVLDSLVSKGARVDIGTRVTQMSLLSFYSRITKTEHLLPGAVETRREVPQAFQHLVTQFSPSSEGLALRRSMVRDLQGKLPPVSRKFRVRRRKAAYDSDNKHNLHSLIQNISAVLDERVVNKQLELRCSFHPVSSSPSSKLVKEVQKSMVTRELIKHQAHIIVPVKAASCPPA